MQIETLEAENKALNLRLKRERESL
jgi:hypothetical protein